MIHKKKIIKKLTSTTFTLSNWGQVIIPTAHCSDGPLFRQPIAPTAHYSDSPLLRRPIISTAHSSDSPFLRQPIISSKIVKSSIIILKPVVFLLYITEYILTGWIVSLN